MVNLKRLLQKTLLSWGLGMVNCRFLIYVETG